MRQKRIKVEDGVYHCLSRIVGSEPLLGDIEKEQFRKQMWKQIRFTGLELLTYCFMSNHIHVFVRVPQEAKAPDDALLLERARGFYGVEAAYVKLLEEQLPKGGDAAERLRKQLQARMGDVSMFMKELKQRFSCWYNARHDRRGTLWSERFKSLVVEPEIKAMGTVGSYIDLNPVRAGLVEDPAEYRWSGYGEAMGGGVEAQAGLCKVMGRAGADWAEVRGAYRLGLFVKGGHAGGEGKAAIGRAAILEEVKRGGELEMGQVLRLRLRYLSDGVALGSRGYVEGLFRQFRDRFSAGRKNGARRLRLRAEGLKELAVLRDLRVDRFG